MLKNKKFAKMAIPVLVFTFMMMYYYGGINVEQLNALMPYYISVQGWSATALSTPITVSQIITVPLTFIVSSLLVKFDTKRVLSACAVLAGVCIIFLGFAGTSVAMYWIGMLGARSFAVTLSMGSVMMATNWFVEKRGTALGIITIGCPVCTATLVYILTYGINQSALGMAGTYTIWGGILIALGILMLIFTKSTPEEMGLYPDGLAQTRQSAVTEASTLTAGEILKNPRSWLLVISFGILNWCVLCVSAYYTTSMMMSGSDESFYLLWLTIGSLLGIPVSYVLGVLDDKLGTPKASLILCAMCLLSMIGFLFMTANNLFMIILVAIGMGGLTGGTANLHPSLTAYVFGHKNFQRANRWIGSLQALVAAFAPSFMAAILDGTGSLRIAYIINIVLVILAAICILIVGRKPDFDKSAA